MTFLIMTIIIFLPLKMKSQNNSSDSLDIYEFSINDKKYELVKNKYTWSEAALISFERGGILAEVNSRERARFDL